MADTEDSREKKRAYMRAWEAANRERRKEYARARRRANPEKEREKARARRAYFREWSRAKTAANPEEASAKKRAYRVANREKVLAYKHEWNAANPEKAKEMYRRALRKWKAENPMQAAYYHHKSHAIRRNIPFLLTFDEWAAIWIESGRWEQRGIRKGQYVMARHGDMGPYAIGNVRICTGQENNSEAAKFRWARIHGTSSL